jgi:bifunctional enzyme CysN/CysC/sulfate adenylyltransferase subunit 1
MIVGLENLPGMDNELTARICWMHPKPLKRGWRGLLKHTAQTVQAMISSIDSRIDIATFDPESEPADLKMNDIGQVRLRTARPLIYDGYASNRMTGSFILIEPGGNATAAAGMLHPPQQTFRPDYDDFAI